MTEFAPTSPSALEKERAKLVLQREKLEYEETILGAKEAFGVYDKDVAPAEGEVTYEQYLAERPAEGIVRSFDGHRDAQTGQFASQEAYSAQLEGTLNPHRPLDSHIEAAIKSNEGQVFESPYAKLGLAQLAREASKAIARGDRTAEEDIKEALDEYLTIDIMRDDTETPEQAQARYDAEVARYEQLVARFVERSSGNGQPAHDTHEKPSGEGTPSVRVEDRATPEVAEPSAPAIEAEASEPVETSGTSQSDETMPPVESEDESTEPPEPLEPGAYYNGRKITNTTPLNITGDAKVGDTLFIEDEDGATHEINSRDVKYIANQEDVAEKEPAATEQATVWWKRVGNSIRIPAGLAFWKSWGSTESTPADRHATTIINRNVNEELSDDEKEKQRKKNRTRAIIAVAGIAVAAAAILGVNAANNAPENDDKATNSTEDGPTIPDDMKNLLGSEEGNYTNVPSEVPPAPEVATVDGEGGEALFTRIGLDPARWYEAAPTLLSQFPQDFYQEGNDIRIVHSGPLSQGAQDYINSLR